MREGGVSVLGSQTLCSCRQPIPLAYPRVRNLLSARPKIAELVFQFYGRSLHPELFEVQQQRFIERSAYRAGIKITGTGHVVTLELLEQVEGKSRVGMVLTEVATSAHHPLPIKRRLMSHRLLGHQRDKIECRGGYCYETEFALEHVDHQMILDYQNELLLVGNQQGLTYQFSSGGRLGVNAMSYIHFESRSRSLRIQALHTFPDDGAILKSQSLFTLSSAAASRQDD
jgi:hypothetical protein